MNKTFKSGLVKFANKSNSYSELYSTPKFNEQIATLAENCATRNKLIKFWFNEKNKYNGRVYKSFWFVYSLEKARYVIR